MEQRSRRVTGFAPASADDAHILILGTMPGTISLERGQYYAHPRNAFWPIAAALFDVDLHAEYAVKLRMLMAAGVALWDVLSGCERPGSLDAAIVSTTAISNDFVQFFSSHRALRVVGFNGKKAAQLYRRHVSPGLAGLDRQIRYVTLPSTSPAHAAQHVDAKLAAWRALL